MLQSYMQIPCDLFFSASTLSSMRANASFNPGEIQTRPAISYGHAKAIPKAHHSEVPDAQLVRVLKRESTEDEPWAAEQVDILTERLQAVENTNDIALLISIFFAALYTVFRIVVEWAAKRFVSAFRASFALILTIATLIAVMIATILKLVNHCLVALLRLAIQATPAI
jgi:hypothetical protein